MDTLIGICDIILTVLLYISLGIVFTLFHYFVFVMPDIKSGKLHPIYYKKDYWIEYIMIWPLEFIAMVCYGIYVVIKFIFTCIINLFKYDRRKEA